MLDGLVAVSELIQAGSYRLHSSFNRVINYTSDREIDLIFCLPSIEQGPYRVILKDLDQLSDHIEIEKNFLIQNNITFNSNFPQINGIDWAIFNDNLKLLSDHIEENSRPDSIQFLLKEKTDSRFLLELQKRFFSVVQTISLENFIDKVLDIKGLGVGLTPSGDDFGVGVLIGLNFIEKAKIFNTQKLKDTIKKNFISKNAFSNFAINQAYEGHITMSFKKIVELMITSHQPQLLRNYANTAINHGATSGIDTLSGFLETIKRSLK